MHGLVFMALALTMTSAPISAQAAESADFQYAHTSAQNRNLPYRYFVPPGYSESKRYPLIVFLHGMGERGDDNEQQLGNHANGAMQLLDDDNLAKQAVFMIAPQCPSGQTWHASMVGDALTAVDAIAAQYNIDPDRIYITGLSMGGEGTWNAVRTRPNLFAAAVPMSGYGNTKFAPLVRSIPFWFFHADGDPRVAVGKSDRLVAALRDEGARAIYTRYQVNTHGIWQKAYTTPLLFDWLVAQRRGQTNEVTRPSVRISDPVSDFSVYTDATSIRLAGEIDNGGDTIDSVAWDVRDGAQGSASGTTDWSTGVISLDQGPNLIRVIATGPSYYEPYGGVTTFNDTIRVTHNPDAICIDGFDPY